MVKGRMQEPEAKADEIDKDQSYWLREIQRAEKYFDKFWIRADKLYKLYAKQSEESDGKKKYAMLWANTEVMKPSIYARPPVPQVSRRYKDKDPVGRLAAELLERAASYEFERMNIDSTLRAVRDDLLLPGRGSPWVRYEADIEGSSVNGHRAVCDYIHYRQFLHSPVRRWEEVTWVAKKTFLDNDEGKKRFGKNWTGVELDNKADATASTDGNDDPALVDAQKAKATVYEIWCKTRRKTIFVAKGAKQILESSDPLIDFENFFPCPKPVYSTVTNNSLIPTPDYKYYQDQAEEVDLLTNRIDKLMDGLKVVGFYPAGAEGDVSEALRKAFAPGVENQMIPIASWAAFSERGGGNAIVWLPIKDVAETIRTCVDLRNQVIQDIFQITGISDILRGSTEASETATAQQIKAQWGSVRIKDRQQEMARIARDLTRMVCEVIGEYFDPEVILQMANMERPQPPLAMPLQEPTPTGNPEQDQAAMQQFQQQQAQQQQAQQAAKAENDKIDAAFAILQDDKLRGFRIDIETDSTIQPDENAEKERRTEFVTAVGGLIQQAVPLVAQAPEMVPLIRETLLFTARGFRAGRQLEDQIEQAMQALESRMTQAAQQKPAQDPTVELRAKQLQQDIEHKGKMNEMEQQHRAALNQLEIEKLHQKTQAEIEVGQKRAKVEHAIMGERGELETNQGRTKLREQILSEEQDAFLGQPGEQVNGVAQVLQEMMGGLMQAITQSNASVIASNQQLVSAVMAPKVITAPDGRQYTAQTASN